MQVEEAAEVETEAEIETGAMGGGGQRWRQGYSNDSEGGEELEQE